MTRQKIRHRCCARPRGARVSFRWALVALTVVLVLVLTPVMPALADEPTPKGRRQPGGPQKGKTLTAGDPIFTSGGEFRQTWPLLSLQGTLPIEFSLIYAPDLFDDGINYFGSFPFPPGTDLLAFSSNVIIRLKEFVERAQSPQQRYVNIFRDDETLVFLVDDEGHYTPLGDVPYQLEKRNGWYYLMDPQEELVYIFRSQNIDLDLVYSWGTGSVDQYIATEGQVAYIIDRNGNTLHYTYNQDNNPVRIEDDTGYGLSLIYRTVGWYDYLDKVVSDDGRTVTFDYEEVTCADGDEAVLVGFHDPEGHQTTFEYFHPQENRCNLIGKIVLPAGNAHFEQTWTQNPWGVDAVQTQTDAYGNQWTLSVTGDGQTSTATVTSPDGAQHGYTHANDRYPTTVTDAAGNQTTLEYNDRHQVTRITDNLGNVSQLAYHPESGKLASFTDANGQTLAFAYDEQAQTFTNPANGDAVEFVFYDLSEITYADGTRETFTYDAHGNLIAYVEPSGAAWRYAYDEHGWLTQIVNPLEGVTTYAYNPDGTLASMTDSDTGETTFAYDAYRRVSQITYPDGSAVSYAYDLMDRITTYTDETGATTTFAYDANGNLIAVTDAAGKQTQLSYDLMDRVEAVTDSLGQTTTFAYDAMGNLRTMTDPTGVATQLTYNAHGDITEMRVGGHVWAYDYNAEGLLTAVTTPMGQKTTYAYDPLGNITRVTDPLGNAVTYAYDAQARLTARTDPLGRVTRYAYTPDGRLSAVTLPDGSMAQYQWNALGLLQTVTDLHGSDWQFDYTPMGRLAAITDPLGNTWQYAYDEIGQLASITYPDGGSVAYTYDAAGRVTQADFSDGTVLTYAYDAQGRLLRANGVEFDYDSEDHITVSRDAGGEFSAEYDAAGRIVRLSYGDALTVSYEYDPATGLLTRVSDNISGATLTFEYNDNLQLTGITRSNGVNARFEWDDAGRLVGLQEGDFLGERYTLNAAGEVVSKQVAAQPLDPAQALQAHQGETQSLTYDAASQIASEGYRYDARGRLVAAPEHTYAWDDTDRLTGVDDVTLAYNGLGDVVSRTTAGQTITYHHHYALPGAPIVAEETGEAIRYYVWDPASGRLLYAVDGASHAPVFYHYDRVGSTLALTNADGKVTDAYAYTPYGALLAHEGESNQPFTYAGAWGARREGDTLYQMGVRYYDAATGRFLSRETLWPALSEPRMLDPYAYAFQNPVSWVDAAGLAPAAGFGASASPRRKKGGTSKAEEFNRQSLKDAQKEGIETRRLRDRMRNRRRSDDVPLANLKTVQSINDWLSRLADLGSGGSVGGQTATKAFYSLIWKVGEAANVSKFTMASKIIKMFSVASKASLVTAVVGLGLQGVEAYQRLTMSGAETSHLVGYENRATWNPFHKDKHSHFDPLTWAGNRLGHWFADWWYSSEDEKYAKPAD